MQVHLIRTKDVDDELFAGVVSLLQAIPGPIQVVGVADYPRPRPIFMNSVHEGMYEERMEWDRERKIPRRIGSGQFTAPDEAMHWSYFYRKADAYRQDEGVPPEDIVIVLSELTNHRNWFSALDADKPTNGFIHTADWELFVHAPPMFPVAYEVIALVLQQPIYARMRELQKHVHEEPVGCINDFCANKREIILKLRTADICRPCMEMFQREFPGPVIDHALAIMESLRTKMLYAQDFRQNKPPSRLLVTRDKRFFLPDHANIEVSLRPLEKILYLLFLDHPEGLLLSDLCDHRDRLFDLYARLSNNGGREEMWQRIQDLTNVTSNSASEKISRIKRAFEQSLGTALAQHYIIRGEVGEPKRIALERSLVVLERDR